MSRVPFAAARAWMFDAALPFWAEHGVDRIDGGFYEELALNGAPTACDFKRVRVICRQIYVFAHASLLGWAPGAAISEWGYKYLVTQARLDDGGWARRLSRRGAVIDATVDLYELAFVILAMAWRYRAFGDPEARSHATDTLDFILKHMRAPNGGFLHSLPLTGYREQNPHMHLAEACLAAFEATNEERFLEVAREIVALLNGKFFDGATLGERFDDSWRRIGARLEPGHHYEWVWILAQLSRVSGENVVSQAEGLFSFAERAGVNRRTGAVYDAITADGEVVRASSRIWTNTERIKAALGTFELTRKDPSETAAESLKLIMDRCFADCPSGLWVDQIDEQGRPLTQVVPASCLYHLFLAFSELLRLEPQIARVGGGV